MMRRTLASWRGGPPGHRARSARRRPGARGPARRRRVPPASPIHIGRWGVLSGAGRRPRQGLQRRASQIAIDDRDGKLLGHDIQLTTEDGLCTPEGGATGGTKLAADSTIVGLIGSACSDETVGGIKTLTDAGLTTISPSNTRPALTASGPRPEYAGYLRTAHSDAFQGKAVAEFVYNELGMTKAATIHDGSCLRPGAPAGLRGRVQASSAARSPSRRPSRRARPT